jgi:prepilin-type N-terminal cleavage/methylation domain-containing protein
VRARTRTATTGRRSDGGYTLLELIVVIVIVGVVLTVALPVMRDTLLDDGLDKAVRRLQGAARELRNDAVREQVDELLHLDLDRGSYWVTGSDMTPEKRDAMKDQEVKLPDGVVFAGVTHLLSEKQTEGETSITFFRKGYTQPAVVHLAKGDREVDLVFQPFGGALEMQGGEGEQFELPEEVTPHVETP